MSKLVAFPTAPVALQTLAKLKKEVRTVRTFDELERVARTAAIIQKAFKPIRDVSDKAGEVQIDATRRLKEELKKLPKAKGTRGNLRGRKTGTGRGKGGGRGSSAGGSLLAPPANEAPTLAELGVNKKWAAQATALEGIPQADVERIIAAIKQDGDDLTPANVIKRWKQEQRETRREEYAARVGEGGKADDLMALAASGARFSVIYADPPWTFEVYSGKGKERSAERHYDTMDLDAICKLPVANLASDDCALFLWGVWPELPGALQVVKAWGFEYKTAAFVWVKSTPSAKQLQLDGDGLHWGMGYWSRANTEYCLLATKGSPLRLAQDVHQVVVAPVGEHSEKPEEVRRRIQRLIAAPYLELFSRKEVPGWTTWGNEVRMPVPQAAE